MTRRRVLILAAIVAALLLAADFHDLFALPSLRQLWPCLGDVCGWLTKPIPMALVTLGASLALPRDSARLPVVVNLAAALVSMLSLEIGMLNQFGTESEAAFREIMIAATGGAVCAIVAGSGIYMVVRASKALKTAGHTDGNA